MVLQPAQLAELDFLADELFLEDDGGRRRDMALHLYMHAFHQHDLGRHARRLLAFTSTDPATLMHVGKALAVHAFHVDDGALVSALLASGFRMHVLQVDHRARVGPGVIGALVALAASAEPAVKQATFVALQRLGRAGADLRPALDVLCASLGERPTGRGLKKLDLDLHARSALATLAPDVLHEELARRAPASAHVQAFLAASTTGATSPARRATTPSPATGKAATRAKPPRAKAGPAR